jgi:hypothetical protein
MRFGNLDHPGEAVGEKPIVSVQHLAVPTMCGKLTQRVVPIRHQAQECMIVMDANAWVLLGVMAGNFQRAIPAAVINDDIFPVGIGLSEDTFNTLCEILSTIIDWSHYTDQGRCLHIHTSSSAAGTFVFKSDEF